MSGGTTAGGRSRNPAPGSPPSPAPSPRAGGAAHPEPAAQRIAAYESALDALGRRGRASVSLEELARLAGLDERQVREDLAGGTEDAGGRGGEAHPLTALRGALGRLGAHKPKIPKATVERLSTYARVLNQIDAESGGIVSSAELARRCGLNPAQIRKDLAYFGGFGVRGKGYAVENLRENLQRILGVTQTWKVVLVGAGNLGTALLAYKGFLAHGFIIEAVFDKLPEKVPPLKPGSPPVLPMGELARVVRERGIRIGIVAVPAESAQGVAARLVEAGVTGILNFAPVRIAAPPHVKVNNIDLGKELESISYFLSKKPAD